MQFVFERFSEKMYCIVSTGRAGMEAAFLLSPPCRRQSVLYKLVCQLVQPPAPSTSPRTYTCLGQGYLIQDSMVTIYVNR